MKCLRLGIACASSLLGLAVLAPVVAQAADPPRATAPEAEPEAPTYAFEGRFLTVVQGTTRTPLDLGCEGRSALRSKEKLFVACGSDGVVQLDVTDLAHPRIEGRLPTDGQATGLFVHDGQVWVEVAHVDAHPLGRADHAGAPHAVGVVADGARPVHRAPLESEAPTSEPIKRTSLVAPPRRGNLWELSGLFGGFLAFGKSGGGVLGEASVVYRFDLPIVMKAELAPVGIGAPVTVNDNPASGGSTVQDSGTVSVAAAHVLFGLDMQFFELTLGVGGATVNNPARFFDAQGTAPTSDSVTVVEEARIGARDGLSLTMESVTISDAKKFDLGSFNAVVQIPLTQSAALILRGGGGKVGWGAGDLGVRVVVKGDGGPGTIALRVYAGGAHMGLELCRTDPVSFASSCKRTDLNGPALGGGIEVRL